MRVVAEAHRPRAAVPVEMLELALRQVRLSENVVEDLQPRSTGQRRLERERHPSVCTDTDTWSHPEPAEHLLEAPRRPARSSQHSVDRRGEDLGHDLVLARGADQVRIPRAPAASSESLKRGLNERGLAVPPWREHDHVNTLLHPSDEGL